jgi:hypothetical protein
MIVSAAICPSPPLLARELTGRAEVLPELRDACTAAVSHLLAAAPDVVAIVGAGQETATWNPDDRLDLSAYGPLLAPATPKAADWPASASAPADARGTRGAPATRPRPAAAPRGKPGLPLALGVGALLLDEAGYAGPRILQAVDESASPADCLRLGHDLSRTAARVALLAVGDGSTRRGPAAPGYLDERAVPFDDAMQRAVRDGDMAALAGLDPDLARDLMATGRAAWQVLAGAFAAARPAAEISYAADPFGVAYLVATLT